MERIPTGWQADVVDDFRRANTRRYLLKSGIDLGVPYSLITPAMAASIVAEAVRDPQPAGGPTSEGLLALPIAYVAFSAVGFNPDKTVALVYLEHTCRKVDARRGTIICNQGDTSTWEKTAGQWQPQNGVSRCGWIS